jgi:hypothetical protein
MFDKLYHQPAMVTVLKTFAQLSRIVELAEFRGQLNPFFFIEKKIC